MNSIYSLNDSESRKTRAHNYFHEKPCSLSVFNTSTQDLI